MAVDDNNFLKLFKVHNNHRKILVNTNIEVNNFRELKDSFDQSRHAVTVKDQVDFIFEFQALLEDQVLEAQKRLASLL